MSRARSIANQATTLDVDGGTIKLDGNYPVGTNNVAMGDAALDDGSLTGSYNTAVGSSALSANTTGQGNTASGYTALLANTTGNENSAFGQYALYDNTSGSNNVAIGRSALENNTTSSRNTAVGFQAGYSQTVAGNNVNVGSYSGYTFNALSGSGYNVNVGDSAGYYSTGIGNTYIGDSSGVSMTSGSKNTIVGRFSGNAGGLDIRTSSNNIVLSDGDGNPCANFKDGDIWEFMRHKDGVGGSFRIFTDGNDVTNGAFLLNMGGGDATMYIGHDSASASGTRYIEFRRDNGTVGNIALNGSSAVSYNTTSDYRLKENVVDLTDAITRLNQIPVHQFNFIGETDRTVDGFLAHEVQGIVPEAVTGEKDAVDAEGNPEYQAIDQSKLVPLLTAALKEAITEIESLKARVTALESN